MYNVLEDMLCRHDVLALLETAIRITDDEDIADALNKVKDGISSLTYWNVIEAGNINIVVENLDGFREFLKNQANRG